jgi:F-type H+-transporting ATPase subunit delta
MPIKNDEKMALADVYAEALLDEAIARGTADDVAAGFADLVAHMDREPEFGRFMTAGSVDDDPRRASLERLFRGRLDDLLLNLLQVLNNRHRLDLVREVQRCVELRMEARRQQQEIVVETAMPLDDGLRSALKAGIGAYIGKEALLIERVVPELIGGVVIHVDDTQIDGSVASRIRTMRGLFSERAVHEIHGGRGYEA